MALRIKAFFKCSQVIATNIEISKKPAVQSIFTVLTPEQHDAVAVALHIRIQTGDLRGRNRSCGNSVSWITRTAASRGKKQSNPKFYVHSGFPINLSFHSIRIRGFSSFAKLLYKLKNRCFYAVTQKHRLFWGLI